METSITNTEEKSPLVIIAEKKISDLKIPVIEFYESAKKEVNEILSGELSKEKKAKAYEKRQELRTKRIESTKLVKIEAGKLKEIHDEMKGVGLFISGLSKPYEDQLQKVEDDWKAKVEEELKALETERTGQLVEIGEEIIPSGLAKLSKTEFKILLKNTARKIQEKKETEEKAAEELRIKEEAAEVLRLENEQLKLEAKEREAEAEKLREKIELESKKFRKEAAEKLKSIEKQAELNRIELEQIKAAQAENILNIQVAGRIDRQKSEGVCFDEVEKPKVLVRTPVFNTNKQKIINDWVDCFELPSLITSGMSEDEQAIVQTINSRFEIFKNNCKIK